MGIKTAKQFTGVEGSLGDIKSKLSVMLRSSVEQGNLDNVMKKVLHPVASQIVDICIPNGQWKPFPR
jgi:hypothetical protein